MAVSHLLRTMRKPHNVMNRIQLFTLFSNNYSTQSDESLYDRVDNFIKSNDIVMFSKTTCGFCMMAKTIMNQYSDQYKVMELNKSNDGYLIQKYLFQLSGSQTVPQIFIHGKYIGGCNDIMKLHGNGSLKGIIHDLQTEDKHKS